MNETMIKAIKLTDDFGADIWFVLDKIVLLKKGRYGGTVIYTVDGHSELVKEEVKEVIDEIERIESSQTNST